MHPAQGTVRVTTDAGVTRLVNARRYKVRSVQSILFVQPTVPTGPEKVLLDELGREELSPIEQRVKDLLEERPCWTRTALLNQLTAEEVKALNACVTLAVSGAMVETDASGAGTSRAGPWSATRSRTDPSATSPFASAMTLATTPKRACASPAPLTPSAPASADSPGLQPPQLPACFIAQSGQRPSSGAAGYEVSGASRCRLVEARGQGPGHVQVSLPRGQTVDPVRL